MAEKNEPAAGRRPARDDVQAERLNDPTNSPAPATRASLPVTIAAWPKNGREELRVRLDRFHGRDVVDARVWWTDDAGELRPGKAGLTLAARHLPALAQALAEAVAVAREIGALAPETGEPESTDTGRPI